MEGYTDRFSINGVYNQSDPFRTEEAAWNYAEHIDRFGGISADNVAPVNVERESHFTDTGRYG